MTIINLVIGLFFSAFFSACEAAFLSIDKIQKNKVSKKNDFFSRLKLKIIDQFNYYIVLILIGNIFFNVLATISANQLFFKYFFFLIGSFKNYSNFIETFFEIIFVIFFTGIVLIFSELIPKIVAIRFNFFLINIFAPVLLFLYLFFSPFFFLFKKITQLFFNNYNTKKNQKNIFFNKKELIGFITRGEREGSIKKMESLLMETTINYINTSIKSFLITRDEIEGINLSKYKNKNLLNIIKKFPHKNIPIYEKQKDNIIGIINKQKIAFLNIDQLLNREIKKYLDTPKIISENKNVLEVLNEIINSQSNMALIIDEYGGIEGIVNKNDIINKVVKRKEWQYSSGDSQIKKIDEFTYQIRASMLIHDLNEMFKIEIKSYYAETVGGYLLEKLKEIPVKNQVFKDKYFTYTIKSSSSNRINKITLKLN